MTLKERLEWKEGDVKWMPTHVAAESKTYNPAQLRDPGGEGGGQWISGGGGGGLSGDVAELQETLQQLGQRGYGPGLDAPSLRTTLDVGAKVLEIADRHGAHREMQERIDKLGAEYDRLHELQNERFKQTYDRRQLAELFKDSLKLADAMDAVMTPAENRRMLITSEKIAQLEGDKETARRGAIRETLKKIRPMGGEINLRLTVARTAPEGAGPEVEQRFQRVAQMLPKAWLDDLNEKSDTRVMVTPGVRAHYNSTSRRIDLGPADDDGVALHEFAHRVEVEYGAPSAYSGLRPVREVIQAFKERREGDERAESLSDVGAGMYDESETAVRDDYFHPYVGKRYSSTATEVLSMGLQFLYFPTHSADTMSDPEHAQLIVGLLAAV